MRTGKREIDARRARKCARKFLFNVPRLGECGTGFVELTAVTKDYRFVIIGTCQFLPINGNVWKAVGKLLENGLRNFTFGKAFGPSTELEPHDRHAEVPLSTDAAAAFVVARAIGECLPALERL